MSDREKFLVALSSEPNGLCDDCLYAIAGWPARQRANIIGRRLQVEGVIGRSKAVCGGCGKTKTVSRLAGGSDSVLAAAPAVSSAVPDVTDAAGSVWHWEGHVQATIAAYLAVSGYELKQVVDTASKEQGVDIIAERAGKQLWVTVKGYPKGTSKTNPNTQSRHWFSHAMFDVVRYRTKRPDIEIGVGLPDGFTSYLNLAPSVAWLHDAAPFTFFWASQDGKVRTE